MASTSSTTTSTSVSAPPPLVVADNASLTDLLEPPSDLPMYDVKDAETRDPILFPRHSCVIRIDRTFTKLEVQGKVELNVSDKNISITACWKDAQYQVIKVGDWSKLSLWFPTSPSILNSSYPYIDDAAGNEEDNENFTQRVMRFNMADYSLTESLPRIAEFLVGSNAWSMISGWDLFDGLPYVYMEAFDKSEIVFGIASADLRPKDPINVLELTARSNGAFSCVGNHCGATMPNKLLLFFEDNSKCDLTFSPRSGSSRVLALIKDHSTCTVKSAMSNSANVCIVELDLSRDSHLRLDGKLFGKVDNTSRRSAADDVCDWNWHRKPQNSCYATKASQATEQAVAYLLHERNRQRDGAETPPAPLSADMETGSDEFDELEEFNGFLTNTPPSRSRSRSRVRGSRPAMTHVPGGRHSGSRTRNRTNGRFVPMPPLRTSMTRIAPGANSIIPPAILSRRASSSISQHFSQMFGSMLRHSEGIDSDDDDDGLASVFNFGSAVGPGAVFSSSYVHNGRTSGSSSDSSTTTTTSSSSASIDPKKQLKTFFVVGVGTLVDEELEDGVQLSDVESCKICMCNRAVLSPNMCGHIDYCCQCAKITVEMAIKAQGLAAAKHNGFECAICREKSSVFIRPRGTWQKQAPTPTPTPAVAVEPSSSTTTTTTTTSTSTSTSAPEPEPAPEPVQSTTPPERRVRTSDIHELARQARLRALESGSFGSVPPTTIDPLPLPLYTADEAQSVLDTLTARAANFFENVFGNS